MEISSMHLSKRQNATLCFITKAIKLKIIPLGGIEYTNIIAG